MTTGVPLDQLHCPTCGERFNLGAGVRFERTDEETAIQLHERSYTIYAASNRPYLTCEVGHKWSIKQLTRAENKYDAVLLGDFLGTA
jgi:hypothetical protein